MRIAIVLTRGDSIGGAQVHVKDLARELRAAGHDVLVFLGHAAPLDLDLVAAGITSVTLKHLVQPIRPVADVRAVTELVQGLAAFRPDVIAAHSSKAGIVARLAGAWLKVPVVYTAHGWAFAPGVPRTRRTIALAMERLLAPFARQIICVSAQDRDLAIQHGVGRPDQLVAVPNGIPDVAVPRARPAEGPPRAVVVARLDAQKDHDTLLAALPQVLGLGLDLLGAGPRRAELAARCAGLGIADRVVFHGHTPNVGEHLGNAQLFALCSHYEGLPLGILEAMRAGLPVVASDVGGVREAVAAGETGLLVAPGDVAGWQQALAALAADPERRAAMGAAGRKRFETHFTMSRMRGETLAVYARACVGPPVVAPA